MRQAVAGTDHEGLEGILLLRLELRLGGGRGGRSGRRLAGEDLHLHGEAHDLLKTAGKQRVVFFVDDIAAELRAAQQPGGGAVQRNHLQLADPQVVGDLGHLLAAKLLYPVKHIGKRIHTEPHFIIPPAGGRYLFNIVAYSGVKYNNNTPKTLRFFPRKNRQMCKIFRPAAARAPAGTALSFTPLTNTRKTALFCSGADHITLFFTKNLPFWAKPGGIRVQNTAGAGRLGFRGLHFVPPSPFGTNYGGAAGNPCQTALFS